MTVSTSTSFVSYAGNGSLTTFAYTFKIFQDSDLLSYLGQRLHQVLRQHKVLTTNYTVTGAGSLFRAVTLYFQLRQRSGTTVKIRRVLPVTQETDYVANDPFPAEAHEDALDKLTMLVQQEAANSDLAISFPEGDVGSGLNNIVPSAVDRAGRILGFDNGGSVSLPNTTVAQLDAAVSSFVNATGNNAVSILYDPAGADAEQSTVQAKLREFVSVKDFGAVGDGVTDDTSAIQDAISSSDSTEIIHFPNGTYKVTGTLEMPLKCSGNFTIDGDVKWSFKKEALQQGHLSVTGDVLIDSVWTSRFNHIECQDITFQSSNAVWGAFWNDFGMIRCSNFVIDVDQGQSVNQNNYHAVKCGGGIHIRGTNTTGVREAHNNMFFSVDTTGANLTASDGTTGHHLLNDSDLNQTNTVLNWYAESTGGRTSKGNWNILADNVDASNNAFGSDRENYRLGSRMQGRQSSFLPVTQNSLSEGSDWGNLNGSGLPVGLTGNVSNVALSSISTNARNSPDFSIQGAQSVGGATFRVIDINYKLTNVARVHATAFVYQEGSPTESVEILNADGTLNMAGAGRYVPLGNNWYLLRISGTSDTIDRAGGGLQGKIRVYTTTSSALTASDFRIMTSFFVTSEAIAPLPSLSLGQTIGFSTAVPTAGTWARGDITWNTTPSGGGTPGWMCVTAGSPGTWKAMANLAT